MSRFRPVRRFVAVAALVVGVSALSPAIASAQPTPTVVLVHGAFADATSWDGVAAELRGRGYPVVTVDNALRGPGYDSAAVEKVVADIPGPVVTVGHSYGGAVITNTHSPNVIGNVYIAAFAPDRGEFVQGLLNPLQYPGSRLLPPALQVTLVDDAQAIGGKNLDGFIGEQYFHEIFAQDVDAATANTMYAHQKSAALWANLEPSDAPSWAVVPNWYLVSSQDRVIPPALQRFMAGRTAAHTEEIDASHASLVSQPVVVADFIDRAAKSY